MITNVAISVRHFIPRLAETMTQYDTLRWYRSLSGPHGLYTPVSEPAATPAVLVGTRTELFYVGGRVMDIEAGGTTIILLFPGTVGDALSAVNAAAAIDAESGVEASVTADGNIMVQTTATGTGASLKIGGDAAAFLGFFAGQSALGRGEHTTLVAGQHQYSFLDLNSSLNYWYQADYWNSGSNVASPRTTPFPADQVLSVGIEHTSVGYVFLAGPSGRPDVGRMISVFNAPIPNSLPGGGVGLLKNYVSQATDKDGYAEIRLIRGSTVDIAVQGTGFVRRIQVPDSDGFDILDPSLVVEDEFGIQEANVPFAYRTTL